MDENADKEKADTRENKIIRVFYAFLFSMPVFFLTPFIVSGRHATNSELRDKYEFLFGSNETIFLNLFIFSFVVCAIAYYWYNLNLDRPASFIFEKFGTNIGVLIFVFLASGLLLGIKHAVLFIIQHM